MDAIVYFESFFEGVFLITIRMNTGEWFVTRGRVSIFMPITVSFLAKLLSTLWKTTLVRFILLVFAVMFI